MPTITTEQLNEYLKRIRLDLDANTLNPDIETFNLLHKHHVLNIPFEALSVHLDNIALLMKNNPIDLSMGAVFHKIVTQKRGGYCYEMNKLFAAVLKKIGFELASHKAGVMWGYNDKRSPAHRLLTVKLAEKIYIADVGFGGPGIISPILIDLEDKMVGSEQEQGGQFYRIIRATDGDIELQKNRSGVWKGLYGFDINMTYKEADYKENNDFTAMHPDSTFVKLMICTMPLETGRVSLTDNVFKYVDYKEGREEIKEMKTLSDYSEYTSYLDKYFNLKLSLDVSFNRYNKGNVLFANKAITYTHSEKLQHIGENGRSIIYSGKQYNLVNETKDFDDLPRAEATGLKL